MDNQPLRQVILETIEAMLELQLKSVRQLRSKDISETQSTQRKVRKRQSLVNLTAEILAQEQRPVHVTNWSSCSKNDMAGSLIEIHSPALWPKKTVKASLWCGSHQENSPFASNSAGQ
jgi:hypothetical protein